MITCDFDRATAASESAACERIWGKHGDVHRMADESSDLNVRPMAVISAAIC